MLNYIIRRLLLLPLTLFAIILVNFIIINLAPGEPTSTVEFSATGEATKRQESETASDLQYLQFREHYGLTLPVLFNIWPFTKEEKVKKKLEQLSTRKRNGKEMSYSSYFQLRTLYNDRARYLMPLLIQQVNDPTLSSETRLIAANLFVRGGTRQGYVGSDLSGKEKEENKKIADDNLLLRSLRLFPQDSEEEKKRKIDQLNTWYQSNEDYFEGASSLVQKIKIFFLDTRFARYLSRVITLDFGSLRNDANKKVIHEVAKRLKISLTLSILPMIFTFALCQVFGMLMATHHNQWIDVLLSVAFLILFAIPIFVVAPFLIEKIALHHNFPFTDTPIPYSGFHSPEENFQMLTSKGRLLDITMHIFLPLVAIMYGSLAVQARLSRTAILEVLRQDYVKTARAKGLPESTVLVKHVGRNAAITIVTSLAASLGIILGGSLIVETVFEINGFGRFFYEAIRNRDYNVILFSAFAGSFLTLIGYLLADISYTVLDPRVSLE